MPRQFRRGARPTRGGAPWRPPLSMIAPASYEISDARFVTHRQVVIRSPDARAPGVGEALTITRADTFYDLTVLTVVRLGTDWTACCAAVRA